MNMNPCVEIGGTAIELVTMKFLITLPKWWPPTRLDYVKELRNAEGWMTRTYENKAVDAIFKLADVHEVCEMGPTVQFEVSFEAGDMVNLNAIVADKLRRVRSCLRRYKEFKAANDTPTS